MLFITGIDALGAVPDEEILVELQPRNSLQDRDADLLGATGIHGRLVDNDIAFLQNLADGLAGSFQRALM